MSLEDYQMGRLYPQEFLMIGHVVTLTTLAIVNCKVMTYELPTFLSLSISYEEKEEVG